MVLKMNDEKWVVVEMHGDWSGVIDVHGIFSSKDRAQEWANNQYFACEIKRIRKAVVDQWA
jgi:hypothetical protein